MSMPSLYHKWVRDLPVLRPSYIAHNVFLLYILNSGICTMTLMLQLLILISFTFQVHFTYSFKKNIWYRTTLRSIGLVPMDAECWIHRRVSITTQYSTKLNRFLLLLTTVCSLLVMFYHSLSFIVMLVDLSFFYPNLFSGSAFRTQNSVLRHSFIWPIMFTITFRLSKNI